MNPVSYVFDGREMQKHLRPLCSALDKPRLYVDFNEICWENIILLSQADITNDSDGKDIEMYAGRPAALYQPDERADGSVDYLLADGVVILNQMGEWNHVKWLCHIDEKRVYWLSDIQELKRIYPHDYFTPNCR